MKNRASGQASVRLSATLLLVGQLLYIVITQFHADGVANDHPAVFTVAETAPHRDEMVGHHTKNLFLKDKKAGSSWSRPRHTREST